MDQNYKVIHQALLHNQVVLVNRYGYHAANTIPVPTSGSSQKSKAINKQHHATEVCFRYGLYTHPTLERGGSGFTQS